MGPGIGKLFFFESKDGNYNTLLIPYHDHANYVVKMQRLAGYNEVERVVLSLTIKLLVSQ